MTDLRALASRVEAATGPDRELDECIGMSLGPKRTMRVGHECLGNEREVPIYCPHYTASLDAAMTLVPEHCVWIAGDYKGLANADYWQGEYKYAKGWASVSDTGDPPGDPAMPTFRVNASSPALALVAASLRARSNSLSQGSGQP